VARRFDPLSYRGDVEAFRTEVAAWLAAAVPSDWMNRVRTGGEHAYVELQREWFEALRAVGDDHESACLFAPLQQTVGGVR